VWGTQPERLLCINADCESSLDCAQCTVSLACVLIHNGPLQFSLGKFPDAKLGNFTMCKYNRIEDPVNSQDYNIREELQTVHCTSTFTSFDDQYHATFEQGAATGWTDGHRCDDPEATASFPTSHVQFVTAL
jgi:hypothetical protein